MSWNRTTWLIDRISMSTLFNIVNPWVRAHLSNSCQNIAKLWQMVIAVAIALSNVWYLFAKFLLSYLQVRGAKWPLLDFLFFCGFRCLFLFFCTFYVVLVIIAFPKQFFETFMKYACAAVFKKILTKPYNTNTQLGLHFKAKSSNRARNPCFHISARRSRSCRRSEVSRDALAQARRAGLPNSAPQKNINNKFQIICI